MNVSDLRTGDILLFSDYQSGIFNYFLSMIRWATNSDYVHVGMIVVDPPFAPQLKGTFLWESSYEGTPDPQDDKIKLGVQLTPIETVFKNLSSSNVLKSEIYVRRPAVDSIFTSEFLTDIHKDVYNKPYDLNLLDWYGALYRKDSDPQKIDRFWCSAFVGYIYTEVGILSGDTDWSIIRPSDFAIDGEHLLYTSTKNMLLPWEKSLIKSL
jgi:hypothetical protein